MAVGTAAVAGPAAAAAVAGGSAASAGSFGRLRSVRQRERLAALGGEPWKPRTDVETSPVFRLRDQPMAPERGAQRGVSWLHFVGSVELRLPLVGPLAGLRAEALEVTVAKDELLVRCTSQDVGDALEGLNGKLRREVNPKLCWFAVERSTDTDCLGQHVLIIGLAKLQPGKAWPADGLFQESIFKRQSFGWTANQALVAQEGDQSGKVALKPGRRSDVEDPFTTSRGWLCLELEHGQTHDLLHWRIVLDQKKLDEVLEKVPYFKVFAADCSERYFKLFIRGDESSPILLGKLGGRVCPELTFLELTTLTREVEGHRIAGTMETVPCLNVTLVKADLGEWEEALEVPDGSLNQPQGSLEDFEAEQLRREREPSPDREDWTPDDWADEQKDMADAAFKAGSFRDAIVYYTRALRHTPLNEKLLSNRSAAYLKVCDYRAALRDVEEAQRLQPKWAKLRFRRGQALRGLRRFDEAAEAFREGKALDPGNPEWDKELQRTRDAEAVLAQRRRSAAAK